MVLNIKISFHIPALRYIQQYIVSQSISLASSCSTLLSPSSFQWCFLPHLYQLYLHFW